MEARKVKKRDFIRGSLEGNIISPDTASKLSTTSDASSCYAGQKFSRKLQEFLLNYRTFVTAQYPLTDE